MSLRCSKFWKLWRQRDDRDLSIRQHGFLDRHRSSCTHCAQREQAELQSIIFLRGNDIKFESDANLDALILKAVIAQRQEKGVAYWAPAAVGAAVAALAVMATLQMISRSDELQPLSINGTEAKRVVNGFHEFPEWNVRGTNFLNR